MSSQAVPRPEHRARWGPICGVLFVVLLVAGFFLASTPDTNKSPQYLLNWYSSNTHRNQLHIALLITDIAVVFGLFWFGYLRDRFGRTDLGARLSPILLAGIIILAGGGLVSNGTWAALTDDPKKMLPATAQALNFLTNDIAIAGIVVGVSIIMWAAGFIIFKTRILPRWLAWVSFVLGVVALAGPIGFFAFVATGIWILIVAVFMWRFESNLPVSGDA
jgi:MFS family permease